MAPDDLKERLGMDFFAQLLFTGVGIGAVYALVALGFVLIFRATSVVNFAQGDHVMIVGNATLLLLETLPQTLPPWIRGTRSGCQNPARPSGPRG